VSAQDGIQGFNLGLVKGAKLEQDRIIQMLEENAPISPKFDTDRIVELIRGKQND
jgi:hypothetical protein